MSALLDALRSLDAHRVVLAVSGGRDSMVLLEAAARACPGRVAAVATFDHGTGAHATRAADHVAARAGALGIAVARGRATGLAATEAAWRAARWRFLDGVAREHAARVVTAHTRDDLVETVAMRILRGSGARGLAAMLAPSPVLRPFLALSREDVAAWAASAGVRWIEDPSNASAAFLRNRVRRELLPAIRAVRPRFGAEMLAVAREAAAVRAGLDAAARAMSEIRADGALFVAAPALAGYDDGALRALWPALAARVGATLDRRGTSRVAAFTISGRPGGTIPLAGGFAVVRRPEGFLVARTGAGRAPGVIHDAPRPLDGAVAIGAWCLRPATAADGDDLWSAWLPGDRPLAVRPWRAGDRMAGGRGEAARRVKRFFGDARVPGMDRAGWPVVLAGGEIVWIPGVRRSGAATDRSGRPGLRYVCERIHD